MEFKEFIIQRVHKTRRWELRSSFQELVKQTDQWAIIRQTGGQGQLFGRRKGEEHGRLKRPDRHNMDSWHEKLFTARKIACNIFEPN